jgi:hypothetical protein
VVCQSEDIRDNVISQLIVLMYYKLRAVGGELVKVKKKDNKLIKWGCRFTLLPLVAGP